MFWFNKLAALICKGKRDSFLTALRTRVHLDYLMSVNRTTITSPKYSGPSGTFPNLSCKRRQYKKKEKERKNKMKWVKAPAMAKENRLPVLCKLLTAIFTLAWLFTLFALYTSRTYSYYIFTVFISGFGIGALSARALCLFECLQSQNHHKIFNNLNALTHLWKCKYLMMDAFGSTLPRHHLTYLVKQSASQPASWLVRLRFLDFRVRILLRLAHVSRVWFTWTLMATAAAYCYMRRMRNTLRSTVMHCEWL